MFNLYKISYGYMEDCYPKDTYGEYFMFRRLQNNIFEKTYVLWMPQKKTTWNQTLKISHFKNKISGVFSVYMAVLELKKK